MTTNIIINLHQQLIMPKNYIVLDLETTGLHPYRHGITEIAAVKFDGEKIVDQFHTLVNPERHISK